MSVWWGKERRPSDAGTGQKQLLVPGEFGPKPELISSRASDVMQEIRSRRPGYTQDDWWDPGEEDPQAVDAGGAFVELFGQQMATILKRLNKLPEKAMVEYFRVAGVEPEAPRPAEAFIRFTLAPAAPQSSFIPRGFQIGANPAEDAQDSASSDEGEPPDLVIFETENDLYATPSNIEELYARESGVPRDVKAENDSNVPFFAFGARPRVGNALQIGLGDETLAAPGPTISLAFIVDFPDGTPPAVARGAVSTATTEAAPILDWEAFVDSQFEPIEVIRDDTALFRQSGVIEMRTPRGWKPAKLEGSEVPRFWLRLKFRYGSFDRVPILRSVTPNMIRATAVRTIQDEVLLPLDERDVLSRGVPVPGQRAQLSLLNRPVVPGSLTIEVDTTPLDDEDDAAMTWRERAVLEGAGAHEQVFTLDPSTGVVTFGDGVEGAALPPGFRNVRARSYKTGGGRFGNVGADQINILLNSAPFLIEATNPLPATGGTGQQSRADTVRLAPQLIRSGNRAVTEADFALMARQAGGSYVAKAHAIFGFHPSFPRQRLPGVVGVVIIPPERNGGPPIPSEGDLRIVADHIVKHSPGGVEVVTSAPKYRRVRARVGFEVTSNANVAAVVRDLIAKLNEFLHPLTGGSDGGGWPCGGTLLFHDLMLQLLRVDGVRAIPRLRLLIDGVSQGTCADVEIQANELFWPESHDVVPMDTR